jgi:outer-membrane receptor for ferric coprogen and ferric-rhodotorulic acid
MQNFQSDKIALYKNTSRKVIFAAIIAVLPQLAMADESLPEVEVVSSTIQPDESSEKTKSYTINSSSSAIRLDTSLRETPQSISVITRELLNDFRLTSVNDALSYATGIMVDDYETDRNEYSARGFDITNFQVDGIGAPLTYGSVYGDLDLAIYDRLEVLRGANGLLTATGNPSATINFVRKRPTKDFQARVDVSAGSWDNRRIEGDVSGSLNADGSVRGRLVLVNQNKDSYLDRYSTEKNVAYGVIEADITDSTALALGHTYHQNDANGNVWGSLPLLYADDSKRHYKVSDSSAPEWSYWKNTNNITFVELTHYFNNDWKIKGQLTRKEMDSDARLLYVMGNEDRATGLGLVSYPGMYKTSAIDHVGDIYASGPFELAGRKHELVFGATWSKSDVVESERSGPLFVPFTSFENIGNFPLPAFDPANKASDFTTKTTNIYAATKLNVTDALKLTAGGSILSYKLDGTAYGVDQKADEDNKFTPYIGAVYNLNDMHSLYASYAGIYKPQVEIDANQKTIAPLEGKNYEVGFKSEWFNKKLNSSFALFKTEQENIAQPTGAVVNGKSIYEGLNATSKGYEFDLSGEVTDRLSVNAGYTRLMSIKGEQDQNVNPYIPRHLVHLSTVYKVPHVESLKVGASLNWQNDTYVNIGTVRYEQDSYVTLNLMANYKIDKHWSTAVNLYNVTDEKYLTSLKYANSGQSYYAAPLNALATLTWQY